MVVPRRALYSNRGWRENFFENVVFEPVWRGKLFQMKVFGAAIDSVKFSSESELSSRFFGRLKFPCCLNKEPCTGVCKKKAKIKIKSNEKPKQKMKMKYEINADAAAAGAAASAAANA